MAESAFNFESAPTGSVRQFGVLAGALGLKSSKNHGPKSMSARDQSALMAQQHGHNMELESHRAGLEQKNNTMNQVVGHVIGQEASAQTHKQTMAQNRQANKHALVMQQDKFSGENSRAANDFSRQSLMAAQTHRQELALNKQKNTHQTTLNGQAIKAISSFPNISSINTSSGSVSTRES